MDSRILNKDICQIKNQLSFVYEDQDDNAENETGGEDKSIVEVQRTEYQVGDMDEIAICAKFAVSKVFDQFDTERRGMLNQKETEAFIKETINTDTPDGISHNAFPDIFKAFDKDGKGYISKDQLLSGILIELNRHLTSNQ